MAELRRICRCDVCGNVVEVPHSGAGILVCCGKPMRLVAVVVEGAGGERHVPMVKLGEAPHPMDEGYFIEWIELTVSDPTCERFLKPGDPPEAVFEVKASAGH
ncbi:MAG: desulfoferrodoxin [Thermoprotei archaeon]|nr:MAG: desulfoferrodoxin [Thermoprotei archaeon]